MSDDIVTELRRHAEWAAQGYEVTFSKAADEIERLRGELEGLREDIERMRKASYERSDTWVADLDADLDGEA